MYLFAIGAGKGSTVVDTQLLTMLKEVLTKYHHLAQKACTISAFFSLFAYNLQTKKYKTTAQGAWKYMSTLWRLRITSELKLHNTEVSLSA